MLLVLLVNFPQAPRHGPMVKGPHSTPFAPEAEAVLTGFTESLAMACGSDVVSVQPFVYSLGCSSPVSFWFYFQKVQAAKHTNNQPCI